MRRTTTTMALAALVVLAAAGCEVKDRVPPGASPLRYRDATFEVAKTAEVTYGSAPAFDGSGPVPLRLDLYRPTGDTVRRRPLVVFVHGGTFRSGDKDEGDVVDQARVLASKGYVTASIDYRLDPVGCSTYGDACFTAIAGAMHDAQAAVRFLRNKDNTYGIDPGRIAIAGSSAGAITAVNVAYAGPDVGASGTPGVSSKVRVAVSLSGAAILTDPDPGEPPVLFLHSRGDKLVPFSWMEATRIHADEAGTDTELTAWDGTGHVPYLAHRDQILAETTNFLYHHLDLAHAAR